MRDFLGVNTHLGWRDTAWGAGGTFGSPVAKIESELHYLGVSQLRDGIPVTEPDMREDKALAAQGARFLLLQSLQKDRVQLPEDVARLRRLEQAQPGMVVGFEGINEFARNSYMLNGALSRGNPAWGLADAQALWRSAAPLRRAGISLVAPTTGTNSPAPDMTRYVDCGNWHVYGGVAEPLTAHIAAGFAAATRSATNRPAILTEIGISSAPTAAAGWGVAGNEHVQAEILLNAVLDAFATPLRRIYLYELMDDRQRQDQEDMFGLFHADGTPKLAATGLRNLLSLVGDDAIVSQEGRPFHLLLKGAANRVYLVLWNTATNPSAATIIGSLPRGCSDARIYRPLQSAAGKPMAAGLPPNGFGPAVISCRLHKR